MQRAVAIVLSRPIKCHLQLISSIFHLVCARTSGLMGGPQALLGNRSVTHNAGHSIVSYFCQFTRNVARCVTRYVMVMNQ